MALTLTARPSIRDSFRMVRRPSWLRDFWLLARALRDFVRGFRSLQATGPCVTVFGSARCGPDHPYYQIGQDIGRRLTDIGFAVMTGGGPGLMEAANKGAMSANGRSIGCNIRLPLEQSGNRFVNRSVVCHHFFVRKVLLFKYSYAFVALPGGFGTIDELFEALTLIQTHKIERFPVVLIGTAYWRPVLALFEHMTKEGMIDASDRELALVTDDLDEATRYIARLTAERFGLRAGSGSPRAPQLPDADRLETVSANQPAA